MSDGLRDRIAAAITMHALAPVKYPLPYHCRCGWTGDDSGYGIGTLEAHPTHVADAVIRGLGPESVAILRCACGNASVAQIEGSSGNDLAVIDPPKWHWWIENDNSVTACCPDCWGPAHE